MEINEIIARTDNLTVVVQAKRRVLIDRARQCAHLPGDMAELGVFCGGSALAIALAAPEKFIYLYDTFTGLPSDDLPEYSMFREEVHKGRFTASIESVKLAMRGRNGVLRPGIFPKTAVDTPYCFVHVDADLYTSTRDAIAFFWPRLVPGGIMVFDDYKWPSCPGVQRAIEEASLPVEITEQFQCEARKPE